MNKTQLYNEVVRLANDVAIHELLMDKAFGQWIN